MTLHSLDGEFIGYLKFMPDQVGEYFFETDSLPLKPGMYAWAAKQKANVLERKIMILK